MDPISNPHHSERGKHAVYHAKIYLMIFVLISFVYTNLYGANWQPGSLDSFSGSFSHSNLQLPGFYQSTFQAKHPKVNNLLRKSFLMTVGAFNSEVLFTNMGATKMDAWFISLIYGAPFIIMDEIVQKYDLDNSSIFYMGSIFGLILEDIYVNTVQESPLFFMSFISTFWHGGITTWSTFTLADQFFPRTSGKPINKPVFWSSIGTVGLMGGAMAIGLTFPTFLENIATHISVFALIGSYTYLIKRNIEKEKEYINRPLLGLSIIGLGYVLGNWIHSLDEEKSDQEQEHTYTQKDWDMRAGFYGTLAMASLIKMMSDRKRKSTYSRFTILPSISSTNNPLRPSYTVRLFYNF